MLFLSGKSQGILKSDIRGNHVCGIMLFECAVITFLSDLSNHTSRLAVTNQNFDAGFQSNHLTFPALVNAIWKHLKQIWFLEWKLTKCLCLTGTISSQDLRMQSELRVWKPVLQPSCTKRHPTSITSLQDRKQVCKESIFESSETSQSPV